MALRPELRASRMAALLICDVRFVQGGLPEPEAALMPLLSDELEPFPCRGPEVDWSSAPRKPWEL